MRWRTSGFRRFRCSSCSRSRSFRYQRSLEEGRKTSNCQTLFGMAKIPTDNHIRAMLDPVHPSHLQGVFDSVDRGVARQWRHGGVPTPGRTHADRARWNRIFLLAKARLPELPDAQALQRQGRELPLDAGGHHRRARPRHGRAADARSSSSSPTARKSRIASATPPSAGWRRTGERVRPLRPIFLGDDLFACQPICQPIVAGGGDFLFTAKPDSHKTLYDFMNGAEIEEMSVIRKEGRKKLTYRYRWFTGAPLREAQGRHERQLDRPDRLRRQGQADLRLRLGHQPGGLARKCRRHRRLRPGAVENRERNLQRLEKQRIPPRT